MSTQNSGWYADPLGRFEYRYWNGTEWTDSVSRQGVQATDPPVANSGDIVPVDHAHPATTTSSASLTIGDIAIVGDQIITPNGSAPLAGSTWIVADRTHEETKIPAFAIVLAIIFALACLLGLLFLLIKEKTMSGYVEVSVHSGDLLHVTQVPARSAYEVQQIRMSVSQAQGLAARAAATNTTGTQPEDSPTSD